MAKGRTNNAIRILVAPQFAEHSVVKGWKAAGHMVDVLPTLDADLILHPSGHFWTDDDWDYAPAALAKGRKNKKARNSK